MSSFSCDVIGVHFCFGKQSEKGKTRSASFYFKKRQKNERWEAEHPIVDEILSIAREDEVPRSCYLLNISF